MKIKINPKILSSSLSSIKKVIPRDSVIPILSTVKLEVEQDELLLSGTNLEIGVEYRLSDVDVIEEGGVCVSLDELHRLVKLFDDDLEISSNGEKLFIETENDDYMLTGFGVDDFPSFPEFDDDDKVEVTVPVEKVREAINYSKPAVATGMHTYALTGLFLSIKEDDIDFVGADGHRMHLFSIPGSFNVTHDFNCDSRSFELISNTDGEELLIAGDKSKLFLETDDARIFARLIEGNYVNYSTLVYDDFEETISLDLSTIEKAVKKASVLSNELVKFSFRDGKLAVSPSRNEKGKGQSVVEVIEASFDEKEWQMNSQYLLDLFSLLQEDEVEFCFRNDRCVVREENSYAIIMLYG